MALRGTIQRAALLTKLQKNAGRRNEAALELEASRLELATLLKKGRDGDVPMTKMCAAAGINRERGYELVRRDEPPRPKQTYSSEGSKV